MRYTVLSPLRHGARDGVVTEYREGEIADLPEADAAQMVEIGTLAPVAAPPPEPEKAKDK